MPDSDGWMLCGIVLFHMPDSGDWTRSLPTVCRLLAEWTQWLSIICAYRTFVASFEFSNLFHSHQPVPICIVYLCSHRMNSSTTMCVSHPAGVVRPFIFIDQCRIQWYSIIGLTVNMFFLPGRAIKKNYIRNFHFIYWPILLMLNGKQKKSHTYHTDWQFSRWLLQLNWSASGW